MDDHAAVPSTEVEDLFAGQLTFEEFFKAERARLFRALLGYLPDHRLQISDYSQRYTPRFGARS